MRIEISQDLRPTINGTTIFSAPTTRELQDIIGPPSRVVEPEKPAPVKHRNNRVHIYDAIGIHCTEHHYTRRITGLTIHLVPEEAMYPRFSPLGAYQGELRLAGCDVSSATPPESLIAKCPIRFEPTILGWLQAQNGEYSVILDIRGRKLLSGRRSERLKLMEIGLSWPHDPWEKPVEAP